MAKNPRQPGRPRKSDPEDEVLWVRIPIATMRALDGYAVELEKLYPAPGAVRITRQDAARMVFALWFEGRGRRAAKRD